MENYEKKYKESLENMRKLRDALKNYDEETDLWVPKKEIVADIEYYFPELVESEDERIRKELIEHIKANKWADYVLFQKFSPDDVIAWLEKQQSVEEIVARCKDSWYNEGKIAGMAEGLTDDEKYQQGWHDALEKQGEQNPAWSEEDKNFMYDTLGNLTELKDRYGEGYGNVGKCIEWLKSLRHQKQWKPSEEQMDVLFSEVTAWTKGCSKQKVLESLYNDLKELKS